MDPSSSGSPRSAELALADDAPSNTTAATTTTATATATPDAPAPAPAAGDAGADAEAAADVAADTDTAHLARFEFSNDGTTKILMVEWYPDTVPSGSSGTSVPATTTAGDSGHDGDHHHAVTSGPGASPASDVASPAWQVSWPGKSTTLPARDADADGARRRVYFLLPPDASIPATVTITPPGRSSFDLKPLPAIFPEGFAEEAGTRGVLHTIWARKRLSELEREMEAELRANAESVGLEMAMAEKQWIVDNFIRSPVLPQPPSPVVARSPGGVNRLGDKLKGLKLATSPADLAPSPTGLTCQIQKMMMMYTRVP